MSSSLVVVFDTLQYLLNIIGAFLLLYRWSKQKVRFRSDISFVMGISLFIQSFAYAIDVMLDFGILQSSDILLRVRAEIIAFFFTPLIFVLLKIWFARRLLLRKIIAAIPFIYFTIVCIVAPDYLTLVTFAVPSVLIVSILTLFTIGIAWYSNRLNEINTPYAMLGILFVIFGQGIRASFISMGLIEIPELIDTLGWVFVDYSLLTPRKIIDPNSKSILKDLGIGFGLMMFALAYVFRIFDIFVLKLEETPYKIWTSKLIPLIIIFVAMYFLTGKRSFFKTLGITRNRLIQALSVGIFLGGLTFIAVDIFPQIITEMYLSNPINFGLLFATPLAWSIFFYSINAIFEEILFRVILLNGFMKYVNKKIAILLQALMFGLWHVVWGIYNATDISSVIILSLQYFVFTSIIGIVLGIYYVYYSSMQNIWGIVGFHWAIDFLREHIYIVASNIEGPALHTSAFYVIVQVVIGIPYLLLLTYFLFRENTNIQESEISVSS